MNQPENNKSAEVVDRLRSVSHDVLLGMRDHWQEMVILATLAGGAYLANWLDDRKVLPPPDLNVSKLRCPGDGIPSYLCYSVNGDAEIPEDETISSVVEDCLEAGRSASSCYRATRPFEIQLIDPYELRIE